MGGVERRRWRQTAGKEDSGRDSRIAMARGSRWDGDMATNEQPRTRSETHGAAAHGTREAGQRLAEGGGQGGGGYITDDTQGRAGDAANFV